MQMASVEIYLNQHFHYNENDFSIDPSSHSGGSGSIALCFFFFFFFFFWTPYTAKGFKKHFAYFVLHTLPTHAHTHSKPMFGYPQNREELQKKKKKKKKKPIALNCTKVL